MNRLKRVALIALLAFVAVLVAVPHASAGADEPSGGEVALLNASSAVDFLYIDQATLEQGSEQYVVVSLGDAYESVSEPALFLKAPGSDEGFEVAASNTEGASMLFALDTSTMGLGAYEIASLSFSVDGSTYSVGFDDCDNRSFELVEDGALENQGANEESHDPVTAYSFDENGELVEEGSVEAALEAAQQATPSAASDISGGAAAASASGIVVAINPGHGGNDSGAVGVNGAKEADLTWKIATYCKQELQNTYGVNVYMTRSQNENPSLEERAQRAYSAGASVYISVHINSANGAAYGAEVWVPNNSSYNNETHTVGTQLGSQIVAKLASLGLYNRGVKTRDYPSGEASSHYADGSTADYYADVRNPRKLGLTGIIVEHAFIDNESDYYNYLSSDDKLRRLGVADAQGIAQNLNILGVDEKAYELVYDYDYYLQQNPDVAQAYGSNNRTKVFQHFLEHGMQEGRRAKESFDVASYYNANDDLRRAFGFNLKSYYKHYIDYGHKEGRAATGAGSLTGYVSKLNGVDYSCVYDGPYYVGKYSDLARVYSRSFHTATLVNDLGLLQHFVLFGMPEGRQANENFDVVSYYNANIDLRRAFGTVFRAYYTHYIDYGRREGRTTKGVDAISAYVSTIGNTDYGAVYAGDYYSSHHSDLKAAFTRQIANRSVFDDLALLVHFVNHGMAEGRQANADFNVTYYKGNYADLQKAFGNNLKSYYLHYINYGRREGRVANKALSTSNIMGASLASADQMAAYYIKVKGPSAYPSGTYASKGAGTLKEYCQIVIEEAAAEGVRAEVVFCQAMHETGWLQYGGDVNASQCNFAGLGAVGGGAQGASFSSVRQGVRAQVQHLKAYASTEPLNNAQVDPRFSYVSRGCAPTLEQLNGKWAVPGNGYGESIYKLVCDLLSC